MSSFYKTAVIAGAGLGLGWAVAEGYGIGGIIGLVVAGGFIGAMIALIKEKKWKNVLSNKNGSKIDKNFRLNLL